MTSDYIDLYKQIHNRKLDCNISLKPSHIGSDISEEVYNENLQKIINVSEETNNFVRIDMESSKATDFTIKSFINEKNKGFNIGTVFQAYLHRTFDDIANLDLEILILGYVKVFIKNLKIFVSQIALK